MLQAEASPGAQGTVIIRGFGGAEVSTVKPSSGSRPLPMGEGV